MEPIKGIDFMIEFNLGSKTDPDYIKIGGQQGATLNRSKELIETTSKDSSGWREQMSGVKEWGIEADGLLIVNDRGYCALENSFINDTKLMIQMMTPSGLKYKGEVIVTDFPIEAGFEDMSTYGITFEGCGALEVVMDEDGDGFEPDEEEEAEMPEYIN